MIMTDERIAVAEDKLATFPNLLENFRAGISHPESAVNPTVEDIVNQWHEHLDNDAELRPIPGVLGVMSEIGNDSPHTLVSVDLCDVVRKTAESFLSQEGLETNDAGENYGYGVPFGIGNDPDIVTAILQGIMTHDKVEPVEGIEEIREYLQRMRNQGAFIIANTSTLPGCEPSTFRFMKKHLDDCFDGIALPRNHDGKGPVTKGMAKAVVVRELSALGQYTDLIATQHIEDAPHHVHAARLAAMEFPVVHFDVTPTYIWNAADKTLNHVDEPVQAFEASVEKFESVRKKFGK
jgi:hypothetical protein